MKWFAKGLHEWRNNCLNVNDSWAKLRRLNYSMGDLGHEQVITSYRVMILIHAIISASKTFLREEVTWYLKATIFPWQTLHKAKYHLNPPQSFWFFSQNLSDGKHYRCTQLSILSRLQPFIVAAHFSTHGAIHCLIMGTVIVPRTLLSSVINPTIYVPPPRSHGTLVRAIASAAMRVDATTCVIGLIKGVSGL